MQSRADSHRASRVIPRRLSHLECQLASLLLFRPRSHPNLPLGFLQVYLLLFLVVPRPLNQHACLPRIQLSIQLAIQLVCQRASRRVHQLQCHRQCLAEYPQLDRVVSRVVSQQRFPAGSRPTVQRANQALNHLLNHLVILLVFLPPCPQVNQPLNQAVSRLRARHQHPVVYQVVHQA